MKKMVVIMCFLIMGISAMGYAGFEEAKPFKEGAGAVYFGEGWGFVDKSGKLIVEAKYEEVLPFSEGVAAVKSGGLWGFVDKSGREVVAIEYDEALDFKDGMARIRKDGLYGFIDKSGKEVIAAKYTCIYELREGIALANIGGDMDDAGVVSGGKFFYLDKSGREISKRYDDAYDIEEGMGMVKNGNMIGFVDKKGREVIKPKYEQAWVFSNDVSGVKLNGKWGFIDKIGREVIKPQYDYVYNFKDEVAVVNLGGELDDDGKLSGGSNSLIDKTGRAISKEYDTIYEFQEGLAICIAENKYSMIDKSGKELDEINNNGINYDSIYDCSSDMILVNNGGEYDETGNITGGKWGYIDKSGSEVIALKYDEAYNFRDNVAVVMKGNKKGLIDKTGKEITKIVYDYLYYSDENNKNIISVKGVKYDSDGNISDGGKYGIYDTDGKEIVKPIYEKTFGFVEDIAVIVKNGKYGYIDKNGKELESPFKK